MNKRQVKKAQKIAASPEFIGVKDSQLKDWRSIRETVCVTIAEVADVFKSEKLTPSDYDKFIDIGQHFIRVTDYEPAPKTPEWEKKLARRKGGS